MDQGVFLEENEQIRNFVQLTYITLSSTGAVPLKRLEDAYRAMEPTIHQKVGESGIDCAALSYAALRLPLCLCKVEKIVLGQSESILEESGIPMSSWTEAFARSRRRRYLYDGQETLICFIASKSDVDDIIPSLLAFQIEWNKIHTLLAGREPICLPGDETERIDVLAAALNVDAQDARKFAQAFQDDLEGVLAGMRSRMMDLYVRNYEASYTRYRGETETWWRQIASACPGIEERPVYFVSSNTHSLINLMSGFAEAHKDRILGFAAEDPELSGLVEGAGVHSSLLYYLLMKYEQSDTNGQRRVARIAHEERVGVRRIAAEKTLDVPTQVVDLKVLAASGLGGGYAERIAEFADSDAMIINIDYPLGRAAYFLLSKLAEHVRRLKGVYVIGKAASLFADRGDVIVPSSIVDQHTRNHYFLENCIRVKDLEPYLDPSIHAIYDNQKAVTVLGTFLQNHEMLSAFLAAGVTDLEMEAGPYLTALYEVVRPKRYPEDDTIALRLPDIDLGIVHYISDNPLAGRHLDRSLEVDGVDATYAATRAVLNRIVDRELRDMQGGGK